MVDQQSDVPATQSPTATSAVPIVSAAGDGDSINQIAEAYVNKHIVVVGILCAISIAVLAYVYILTGTIMQPLILLAMAYALGFYIIYQAAERQFMQELATQLGFTYVGSQDAGMRPAAVTIFQRGHSHRVRDIILGTHEGHAVRIYLFQFTVGYGKNSHTYTDSVFEVQFVGTFPHIILSNAYMGGFGLLGASTGEERVRLEGDFNKYFTMQIEKGLETEAYEIFTPDVMQDLIPYASTFAFEMYADTLYICAKDLLSKKEQYLTMLQFADYLATKLAPTILSIKPSVDAMHQEEQEVR